MSDEGYPESPPIQSDPHVEEAVPHSEIATTVADIPSDFAEPGVADFADAAWGEIADADATEEPTQDESWDIDEDDEGLDPGPVPHDQQEGGGGV